MSTKLRWMLRDGEMILQKLEVVGAQEIVVGRESFINYISHWVDVPTVDENEFEIEPKQKSAESGG